MPMPQLASTTQRKGNENHKVNVMKYCLQSAKIHIAQRSLQCFIATLREFSPPGVLRENGEIHTAPSMSQRSSLTEDHDELICFWKGIAGDRVHSAHIAAAIASYDEASGQSHETFEVIFSDGTSTQVLQMMAIKHINIHCGNPLRGSRRALSFV